MKKYFWDCKSLDDVKALYKKLAMEFHPDRGGDTQIMQEINLQYEQIKQNPFFKFSNKKEETQKDYSVFPEIINNIIGYRDITIELCGNWIWLSGATYKYSKQLKTLGFYFAGEKKLWYWRPSDYKSANREPRSIDYIRGKYGSDIYSPSTSKELTDKP